MEIYPPRRWRSADPGVTGGDLSTHEVAIGQIPGSRVEIYPPTRWRSADRALRVFRLVEGHYVEMVSGAWLPEIGLGLTLWDGEFEGVEATWLRFIRSDGELLVSGEELTRQSEAELDDTRTELESVKERVRLLEEKLRELGMDVELP